MNPKQYSPDEFGTYPGAEALPPAGSSYSRAVYAPNAPDDPFGWMVIRGERDSATAEWVGTDFLSASGFVPVETVNMRARYSAAGHAEEITTLVRVTFSPDTGVYAMTVAMQLESLANEADILAVLEKIGDKSVDNVLATMAREDGGA